MPDNASDVCSVVAEPPKQLKLEEFLNQLSSAIALNKKGQALERREAPPVVVAATERRGSLLAANLSK